MSKRALLITLSLLAMATVVPTALADLRGAGDCGTADPCAPPVTRPSGRILTAAGDIADPHPSSATIATARLIVSIHPTVALTLGDNQYEDGSLSDYLRGYDATWGAFLSKTAPSPGNHEYGSSSTAAGYFAYFGDRSPSSYYSFDVGAWHLISLDSNCRYVGGCDPGSPQYDWLKADLAADTATCTLAYWHHPRWSSGTTHGGSDSVSPFWHLLYTAGADVVLNGHEHNYERFAPQDPGGRLDRANGIVEFVVGTGGHDLYPLGPAERNSRARSSRTFGVLQLSLRPKSYDFEFRPVLGGTFSDSGTRSCH